jgi:phospho-N-acetylmuramoyl-pentapeptide-transferase
MRAILLAGGLSLLFTLLGTRLAIRALVAKGYGQLIRDDGPTTHHTKRGTPTMGGLVMILSVVFAYFTAKLVTQDLPSASALLLLFLFVGLGTVGFLDDYIKIAKQRSLGLRSKAKMTGQILVAVVFGYFALWEGFEDSRGETPASHAISFIREFPALTLPTVLAIAFMMVMIAGASNGVNLTDGLDGLSGGTVAIAFVAYMLIALLNDPVQTNLALLCSLIIGALLGFLWFNVHPAQIFIGDSGALSLGATLAVTALITGQILVLPLIGIIFVLETGSVILQIAYFKLSGGRRLFRMSPIHHHFELGGWDEEKITIRFWIVGILAALLGVTLFLATQTDRFV